MKYVALFLSAVVGGLVGAGSIYVGLSSGVPGQRADEVARVRGELEELRARMDELETLAGDASASLIAAEKVSVPLTLKEELLEAARSAARDVATTVAGVGSTRTDSETERNTALSRGLVQLRAPHEDTRRNGIRHLRRMFAAEASSQVLLALADESALVRKEAAAYFEYLWDPAALEPLVEMMYEDNLSVAEHALDALWKSGEEEAIAELQDYYLTGPVLEMAYEAGKALEENSRTSTVPDGVQRFRDAVSATNPGERRLGVAGIGRWGTASTDEWRVRALAADADERVRTEVQHTLAGWGLEPKK